MQEEVESRSLTLAINTAKLTGRTLKNAIAKLLAYRKKQEGRESLRPPAGQAECEEAHRPKPGRQQH